MKRLTLLLIAVLLSTGAVLAQKSKKGFEYSGTKVRYSMLGKSRMFSEGIKPIEYTIYWNKKKNTVAVQSGAKDTWYEIEIQQVDTIHGHVTHIGYLSGIGKNASDEEKEKARCEVRFLFDKVTIKKGPARLEEFLLEGATVWDDNKVISQ
ncbi:MAG: hypothetical protein KDC13_04625 [Bacteroidetes bacterium]|nr:hypothetical protein [Bacteroidota bacterium]